MTYENLFIVLHHFLDETWSDSHAEFDENKIGKNNVVLSIVERNHTCLLFLFRNITSLTGFGIIIYQQE